MDIFRMDRMNLLSKLGNDRGTPEQLGSPTSFLRNKPAACRCLFGRPTPRDRWDTRRTLRELEGREVDRISEKYNFDIRTSTPLDGRYEWEKVNGDENVAAPEKQFDGKTEIYKTLDNQDLLADVAIVETVAPTSECNSANNCSIESPSESTSLSETDSKSTTDVSNSSTEITSPLLPRKRRMTDFYPVCKRVRFSKREARDN